MKFLFNYETKASDLWQLSMYGIYKSMAGLINVIFTAAMALLTVKYWSEVSWYLRALLILGLSLFTLIQPLLIYRRAKRQVSGMPKDMEIGFDEMGVHVKSGKEKSTVRWKKMKGVVKYPTLLVIYSSATRGYILNNKVLGKNRDALYDYVISNLKK
ncbi:YcxB family protein [Proteiniclasticum sp. C24MP]|uniref:YcxB family protein n=1 Tax=Proteiniclasticum sp. C24MP TaxID=3374101 RepID=UPI003754650E